MEEVDRYVHDVIMLLTIVMLNLFFFRKIEIFLHILSFLILNTEMVQVAEIFLVDDHAGPV